MMGHKAIESAELPRMNLCCMPTQRGEYLLCASRRLSFERLINDEFSRYSEIPMQTNQNEAYKKG